MTHSPDIIFIAGVSGCGKSTVAHALAQACGYPFLEGDDYHPPKNVAHMASGAPLNDDMRWPWLTALAHAARAAAHQHGGAVVSCSALKRSYRDHLQTESGGARVVLLHGTRDAILKRMSARENHYMPTTLLDSQLATLQMPETQEKKVFAVNADDAPEKVFEIVQKTLKNPLAPPSQYP
ncbi:MAG: carbohydrate kinase (thermoresistant glucokinase family) [Celeribacter sp.]|jgi:carbohydrate kinase (thermoresistant glucokinase family)